MKLKLNFSNKAPKVARDTEIILLNNKTTKNTKVKSLNKSILSNKLFMEKKFYIQSNKDKNFIFGPHFSVFPDSKVNQLGHNSIYIQPSIWACNSWNKNKDRSY